MAKNDLMHGNTSLLVLSLIEQRDMYGYQIRQELSRRSNEVFQVKEGSLYGPLYRMFERKLISSKKIMAGEKRFRNYYHIEDAGREYLKYGLAEISTVFSGVHSLLNYEKNEQNDGKDNYEEDD